MRGKGPLLRSAAAPGCSPADGKPTDGYRTIVGNVRKLSPGSPGAGPVGLDRSTNWNDATPTPQDCRGVAVGGGAVVTGAIVVVVVAGVVGGVGAEVTSVCSVAGAALVKPVAATAAATRRRPMVTARAITNRSRSLGPSTSAYGTGTLRAGHIAVDALDSGLRSGGGLQRAFEPVSKG